MNTIRYCKVREVKSPCRAHPEDAGIDFFIPENLPAMVMSEKIQIIGSEPGMTFTDNGYVASIVLDPGQSVLIPSGIKVKVPAGYMLQYTNKSGVASKKHLLVGANVIDIGYEGECHINLHNVGQSSVTINAGDKICQGILVQVGFHQPEEVKDEAELFGTESSARGEGGFGSSGTK